MAAEPLQPGPSIEYSPLYTHESSIALPGLVGASSGLSSLPLPLDRAEVGTSGLEGEESQPGTPSRKLLDGRAHQVLEVDASHLLAQSTSYGEPQRQDRDRPPYYSRRVHTPCKFLCAAHASPACSAHVLCDLDAWLAHQAVGVANPVSADTGGCAARQCALFGAATARQRPAQDQQRARHAGRAGQLPLSRRPFHHQCALPAQRPLSSRAVWTPLLLNTMPYGMMGSGKLQKKRCEVGKGRGRRLHL